jgi:uncharacterized protein
MRPWQEKLIKIVSPLLEKLEPVHGSEHAKRVFKHCLIFARDYHKIDKEVLFAAAWLHDLGQLKLKNGMGLHGHFSGGLATPLLKKAGAPPEKIPLIRQIVEMHEEKGDLSKKKLPTEVIIFHDADKMEGIGAIGLARQFTYSGQIGKKIWDPAKKRNPSLPYGGNFSAMHSILDHDIKKRFYTKKARKMAKTRKEHMRNFIKIFFKEWNFKE